jgi:hypothetical protein
MLKNITKKIQKKLIFWTTKPFQTIGKESNEKNTIKNFIFILVISEINKKFDVYVSRIWLLYKINKQNITKKH